MEQNLRTPGPTPIPREVREAQSQQMVDHRGTEFAELLRETSAGLAELIGTSGEVLLLTGSGSGAMEAAVVNTLSPGDRVLVVTIGSFGDRFAKIAGAFGADVDRFEVEWGTSASPAALRMHLDGSDPYRAVMITHNETSTGVANPLRELAEVVRGASEEPLLIVDGISGLGAMPFEMDDWGVDLVISASQKAWMASPGIAIAALGPRAVAAGETATMPRVYWDFAEARDGPARARRRGRRRSPSCTACESASSGCAPRAVSGPGPATRASPPRSVPAWRPSGCGSSPPRATGRRRSPPPGCRTASTGRRSMPTCARAGW